MNPTTIVYPGTFNPLTKGHVDIVERALFLFQKIIVACASSSSSPTGGGRKTSFLSLSERIFLIKGVFANTPNIEVQSFEGLLVDFVKRNNAKIVLRGLRTVSDFNYELQLLYMNYCLSPEIETIFLSARERYNCISGTLVREIVELGGDASPFVPSFVAQCLKKKGKKAQWR
ncbi:pantetheine-phosphate adenylyltransferase [Coxiella endosymbiont of Amblyomma sculptum]|uniref:pantetheine-phosphate adenylyltransferase n=1 Tax=Coxiella endosymbiont of Amblyomma sculptum TaxID=2487929 RepID=UPI00132EF5AA|nr:pantetheine-phosphate adenylyltransferase [Coxiella endosymbiont of Amblyomma sculptum]QHG92467.1 pantetheine-phosphate adenylyltransferase [Coxiella endosymbiont of Amblyomma sculptum]